MRKVFIMSVVALAVSGCANQQHHTPQVRDLSEARQAVQSTPQYTVKAGDTLYGIAWQHNLDYRELAALNDIEAPYQIFPGQTIALREGAAQAGASSSDGQQRPTSGAVATGTVATGLNQTSNTSVAGNEQNMDWLLPDESAIERNQRIAAERHTDATEQPADTRAEVAQASEDRDASAPEVAEADESSDAPEQDAAPDQEEVVVATDESADAEPEQAAAASSQRPDRSGRTYTPAEDINWRWPADGEITAGFNDSGSTTAGIDISGQKGQPVKAAAPGQVVYAGELRSLGKVVLLKHNDQFMSAYAHNESLNVAVNDVIEAGEVIASMGDSDADSVKLHFEVRRDGKPEDPLDYLPSR